MPQASPSEQLVQGRRRLHFTADKRLFPINCVDAASPGNKIVPCMSFCTMIS
jgi:hypothetical protein